MSHTTSSFPFSLPGRTDNSALAAAILARAMEPEYDPTATPEHGMITTANSSLFNQTHFSEPMTTYALGWGDPAGYDTASEFLAPAMVPGGDRYEHITYPNAEAFLSDEADDDLRALGADFKTVEYTSAKEYRAIPNRGLRMVVDYDKVKHSPSWQTQYTGLLLQRIKRNAFRRKYALAVAAGVSAPLTWDESSDPDADIALQAKFSGDSSEITPNRALWGEEAQIARFIAYGATNLAKSFPGRSMSPAEACGKLGIDAHVCEVRFQNGTTKTPILGPKIILFSGFGESGEDPSNFKTVIGSTQKGGRYAVYIRPLSVKLWEIVVETYETEFCASPLGVRVLSIS